MNYQIGDEVVVRVVGHETRENPNIVEEMLRLEGKFGIIKNVTAEGYYRVYVPDGGCVSYLYQPKWLEPRKSTKPRYQVAKVWRVEK